MEGDYARDARAPRGAFFTPSNTARRNYLYLQFAGAQTLAPGEGFEAQPIDSYLLLYALEGRGEIAHMDKKTPIFPGEGLLINCLSPFSYRASQAGPWRLLLYHMNGASFPTYYQQLLSAHRLHFQAPAGSAPAALIDALSNSAAMEPGPRRELITSTAIIRLLTELIVSGAGHPADGAGVPGYIGGVMEHLNAHYRGPISLDALAASFNVSKYHLSREFKKHTGFSPNEYLISVRMSQAKEHLKRTTKTVAEIARMTGAGDVNHFIQLFKSREGMTPAAFRKRWMGENASK